MDDEAKFREPSEREKRVAAEIEVQRKVYREGTDEAVLRRAAINALLDRGDY